VHLALAKQTADWLAAPLAASANPPPRMGAALSTAAHNARIFCPPFILAAARLGKTRRRLVIDVLLTADLLAQTAIVGAAFGAYGSRLLAFIPHLPLEWLALAISTSVWLAARRGAVPLVELATAGAASAVALLVAGAVETYATPHR
jgi:hypothetical protein